MLRGMEFLEIYLLQLKKRNIQVCKEKGITYIMIFILAILKLFWELQEKLIR